MPIATLALKWGQTAFDAFQTHTYVRWACANHISSYIGLDVDGDVGCWADRPVAAEPFSVNDGTPWVDPITDQACWIDSGEPASYEFLGFAPYLLDFGQFPRTQTMIPLVASGGRPGQVVIAPRSVRLVGSLYAATEAGAAFGSDWLHRVFGDDCAAGAGAGETLTFRRYCPAPGRPFDEGLVNLFDCVPLSIEVRPWAENDRLWWQAQDMEVVLQAGQPWMFGCGAQTVVGVDNLIGAETFSNIERFVSPDAACGALVDAGGCPEGGC